MSLKTLGTINGEGFSCVINQDASGRVYFVADADIDADGANGQAGKIAAYRSDNKGSEHLANGGMKISGGRVVFAEEWGKNIVVTKNGQPLVLPSGVIPSKTWYVHPGKAQDDPAAYVDSETVPYIVVPPLIVQKTAGVVRGCRARATYKGKSVDCVVADLGPRSKIGEVSIAAARALGIPHSPRTGGSNTHDVLYELWPGCAAPGYVLQPA